MVGGSWDGRCETNRNMAPAGGSSRPLRSALAALIFMSSAGWTRATRRRPRDERILRKPATARTCSILISVLGLAVFFAGAGSPSSVSIGLAQDAGYRG